MTTSTTIDRYWNELRGKEIFMERVEDRVPTFKFAPKTPFKMLGMTVRTDLWKTHCYAYENGTELDEKKKYQVPSDCLYRHYLRPGQRFRIGLSPSASTFTAAATAAEVVKLCVTRVGKYVDISVTTPTTILFAAFSGEYPQWVALPTSSYTEATAVE
jgi:hypothetical protein